VGNVSKNYVTQFLNYVPLGSIAKVILFGNKNIKMKTIELKTNIMCGSCIAKVTPVLNEVVGENNWKVDIQNPKKILTLTSDDANENAVIKALQKIGYKAEELA
jgi:copper chaperone CopZ